MKGHPLQLEFEYNSKGNLQKMIEDLTIKINPTKHFFQSIESAQAKYYLALALSAQGDVFKSNDLLNQCIATFKLFKNQDYLFKAYIEIGKNYLSLGDIENGLSYFDNCNYLETKSPYANAKLKKSIACMVLQFGESPKSLHVLVSALQGLSLKNSFHRVIYLDLLLQATEILGKLNRSHKQFEILQKIAKLQKIYQSPQINIQLNRSFSSYFLGQKNMIQAIQYLQKARKESKELGYLVWYIETSANIASILIKQGKSKQAIPVLQEAYSCQVSLQHSAIQRIVYQLIEVYQLLGNTGEKAKLERQLLI